MRVTGPNFLHWYDSQVDPSLPPVPFAYWQDRDHCGSFPIGYPTEALAFFINTEAGFSYDFDDLRLSLHRADDGSLVFDNLGPLQRLSIADGAVTYNIYCTLVIPAANMGLHYFKIRTGSDGIERLRSGYVLVRNNLTNLLNQTTFCRFRHDRFFYNIRYASIPGFYQQFRLGFSAINEQGEGEVESYIATNTGKQRVVQSNEQLVLTLESYHFDRDMHTAAFLLFRHAYIELNGRQYSAKNAYTYSPNLNSKLSKGNIELYDEDFASINRC